MTKFNEHPMMLIQRTNIQQQWIGFVGAEIQFGVNNYFAIIENDKRLNYIKLFAIDMKKMNFLFFIIW